MERKIRMDIESRDLRDIETADREILSSLLVTAPPERNTM